ncbi:MAG: hypothetical protein A6F71_09380 [Cycloclasticus sp. symbiont of Poecilosclerida sp. M]|nr:MAG: hypothetical protein A6F71_09380 [Cycloclasticus sp. symbiont of Poecilosclerida sp. M]
MVFQDLPPKGFLRTFILSMRETKSVEFAFVAICVRSFHKMPVLKAGKMELTIFVLGANLVGNVL